MRVLTKDGNPILVDGKMICVDEVMQISDVQVNGESVVNADGVADIPFAIKGVNFNSGKNGLVNIDSYSGIDVSSTGRINIRSASGNNIKYRNGASAVSNSGFIDPANMDLAVKIAMCDGVAPKWTTEEQLSAQARLGLNKEWKLKGVITDNNTVNVDLSGCTELYISGIGKSNSTYNLSSNLGYLWIGCMRMGYTFISALYADTLNVLQSVYSKYTVSENPSITSYNTVGNGVSTVGKKVSDIEWIKINAGNGAISECNIEIYAR